MKREEGGERKREGGEGERERERERETDRETDRGRGNWDCLSHISALGGDVTASPLHTTLPIVCTGTSLDLIYVCLAVTCHRHFGQNGRGLSRAAAVS